METCDICREITGEIEPPGGLLWDTELVLAFHVPPLFEPEPLIGHLLIVSRRHADTWADLTADEACEIGRAAAALSVPLRALTRAERIYSAVVGQHAPHFHLHVFPRYPGTPEEFEFTVVDEWEGSPKGGAAQIAEFVQQLRGELH